MTIEKIKYPTADRSKIKEACISVKNLNLFYGKNQALHDVSIDIFPNDVTSLIGPSGCGKTTFLRCLNRMNDVIDDCHIQGEITINNVSVNNKKLDVVELRSEVGMVFQKPNPFPKSIYDNVSYGAKLKGIANSKSQFNDLVERSLTQAGLWDEVKDRLDSPATSLSGGQQQRLCIARAIAVEPSVILMDEPCSALDPIATARIEELLHDLKETYTIIIVTHSMQQAARVSSMTAFFHLGSLIEYGHTEDIFTNPQHSRTQDYITGRIG